MIPLLNTKNMIVVKLKINQSFSPINFTLSGVLYRISLKVAVLLVAVYINAVN